MTSVVITGQRYLTHPEQADSFGPFEKTYLAEGDSWMDASALVQGSLPFYLVQEFNRRKRTVLIINISRSGETLQRIGDTMQGEYLWWLKQQAFDGILFSAAGNDVIDAARDPDAGQGLLRDMAGLPLPANGYDCVDPAQLAKLVNYLNINFGVMVDALRGSARNAGTPMYLNSYDTPVARNAPAVKGKVGPWLYDAFNKNHIDRSLWTSLTNGLFADIRGTIDGWAANHAGVHAVPTTGVLTQSDPDSTGSNGDWKNEIHPNESGWKKQAKVWADTLLV